VAGIPTNRAGWRRLIARIAGATGNPAEAEDLLHSAFVRLEEYKATRTVGNPTAFLIRTAANLAIDEHRKHRVRRPAAVSIDEFLAIPDDSPLQDEALEARARLDKVRRGLEGLSPRTREIFLRCRLANLTYREVAAEHGISVSAVEKHIAKAMLAVAKAADEK
jgi:RNA polymerase sigma-70 factor (ECF subfamily)